MVHYSATNMTVTASQLATICIDEVVRYHGFPESIISDRDTGRSKGFGFVEMTDDAGADAAINMFNGQDFEGRKLTVNIARPLEPRASRMDNRRPM